MAYKTVSDPDAETTIALGGMDKNGKKNPTQLEGYYLGSKLCKSEMSQSGFAKLHIFQTPKGNVGVWGKTKLDSALGQVDTGNMVKVTFTGVGKPSKGRKGAYLYTVEFDPENTIEVATPAAKTAAASFNEAPEADYSEEIDSDDESYEDEEEAYTPPPKASTGALSAADRAAKVQALLGKNKAKN